MKKSELELLDKVIQYSNEDIIFGFMKKFKVDEEEANLIFIETKKWLWLCYIGNSLKNKFSLEIDDSILIIDEMWHNFILFTKDYHDFCFNFFGYYIHHQPSTKRNNDEWFANPAKGIENYKKSQKKQYNLIYDYLGEDTLQKWYVYFADKYTKKHIKKISL